MVKRKQIVFITFSGIANKINTKTGVVKKIIPQCSPFCMNIHYPIDLLLYIERLHDTHTEGKHNYGKNVIKRNIKQKMHRKSYLFFFK